MNSAARTWHSSHGAYRGKLKAAILDWAGTTVDHGSLAPVRALQSVFASRNLAITEDEARRDMGLLKKDHIRQILTMPRVNSRWLEANGSAPAETDVESLFAEFIPKQMECLAENSAVIYGVPETVERMRRRDMKIGSTTGYVRPMLNLLLRIAAEQGYAPDCALCPEDVGAGRPFPWMCYQNAIQLKVYPLESVVKIGDTIADVEEGLNAGIWTIGVTGTGNLVGLTEQEWRSLSTETRQTKLGTARQKLLAAGAHYVIDSLDEFDTVVDEIEERLRLGERP